MALNGFLKTKDLPHLGIVPSKIAKLVTARVVDGAFALDLEAKSIAQAITRSQLELVASPGDEGMDPEGRCWICYRTDGDHERGMVDNIFGVQAAHDGWGFCIIPLGSLNPVDGRFVPVAPVA